MWRFATSSSRKRLLPTTAGDVRIAPLTTVSAVNRVVSPLLARRRPNNVLLLLHNTSRLLSTTSPGFSLGNAVVTPSLTESVSAHYWQKHLSHLLLVLPQQEEEPQQPGKPSWTAEDWKHLQEVYRQGRSVVRQDQRSRPLYAAVAVQEGLEVLQRVLQERQASTSSMPSTAPLLEDPWLIKAWRDVALATDPSSPTVMSSEEMMVHMLHSLEANLWDWSPHIVMWILDVAQHERAFDWENVLAMVAQLTHNYAADRPLDAHLTTRLLQAWAASGRPDAPEQATALVEHLKDTAVLDAHIYAALVHVWAKSGRADAGIHALQLLWQGQQQHGASFATPVVVYNSAIHALCKSATLENDEPLVQAHSLLEELLSLSKDLKPNTATYTPLLKAYLHRQDWRAAVDLWRRMSKRPEERLRPHWAAHKVMHKALERHVRRGGGRDATIDDGDSSFDELLVDWQIVAEEWKGIMTTCRETPTPTSLVKALDYLDQLSLASAVGKYAPHWKVPVKDMDFLIDIWRRTGRRKVSLRSMLWRVRKYQGIELLHPGNRVLDWMMEALGHVSETPTAAARSAEILLNLAVEDCQYDVDHRDFVNKLPVTRLIRLWADTPQAPEAAEAVWGYLQEWYAQSGERSNLRPDDLVYGALVRAWERAAPSEKAHRAWQLWQERLETQPDSPPGIMLYQVVANTLSQAGRVSKTEQLVTQVIRAYVDGDKRLRPNDSLIAALVMAHCRAGQPREAVKALADMEARVGETGDCAYQPNVQCYNIVLNAFAELGKLDEVHAVLDRMLELATAEPNRSIHPDIVTWNSYLKSVIKNESDSRLAAARAKAVLRKLQEMRRRFDEAPAPDIVTYHCVLKCYWASIDPLKHVKDAEDIVKAMETDPGSLMPDSETYSLLLRLFHKAGGLGDKALLHLQRFCRLAQDGKVAALPEVRHFNTVISSFLLSDDAARIPKVFSILQLMRGLADQTGWMARPNRETFSLVVDHCRQSHADPKFAEEALNMMEAQWMDGDEAVKPDSTVYGDVMECWARSNHEEADRRIDNLSERVSRHNVSTGVIYQQTH